MCGRNDESLIGHLKEYARAMGHRDITIGHREDRDVRRSIQGTASLKKRSLKA